MALGIIYLAENSFNCKLYIGMTNQRLSGRKSMHKFASKKSKCHFANAIRKHGWDTFTWHVIDKWNSRDEGEEKEKYWINLLMSNNPHLGYNLTEGGDGGDTSWAFTDETRRKISDGSKRSWKENYEQRCSLVVGEKNPMYGKKHTKESIERNRMHQPMLGKKEDPERTKKRIEAMKNSPKWQARFNKGA